MEMKKGFTSTVDSATYLKSGVTFNTTMSTFTSPRKDRDKRPSISAATLSSLVQRTNYSRVRPSLKKYCPEQWGRELDNHYHPEVHKMPFVVVTKAPES